MRLTNPGCDIHIGNEDAAIGLWSASDSEVRLTTMDGGIVYASVLVRWAF